MPSNPKYSALLVDDDATCNFLNSTVVIESDWFEMPLIFSDPKMALNYLQQNCLLSNLQPFPHLILVDINMPGMDGFEFVQELKQMCSKVMSKTLICFLSTSTNSKDTLQAKTLGVDCYYSKPLDGKHLEELVIALKSRL